MTPQTCRQCGRPITNDIVADPRGYPTNVYTHRACRRAYAAAAAAHAAAAAQQFNFWGAQP